MGQRPSYSIRRVEESDKDDILSIHPSELINRGCDYLPDYFDMLMRSINTEGFVIKSQDKIIAVAFFSLVDNKKTLVLRAYRIHPDFAGRRLSVSLTRHAVQVFRKAYNVKQCHFLTKVIDVQEKVEKKKFEKLVARKKLAYISNETTMSFVRDSKDLTNIQKFKDEDLKSVFQSDYLRSIFFENDIFIAFLVPYKALQSNVPHIINDRSLLIGSNVFDEANEKLLSYGEYSGCLGTDLDYYIDMYGVLEYCNSIDVKCHIKSHIAKCITHTKGNIHMFIYVNDDVNTDLIDDTMKELGMSKDQDAECLDAIFKVHLNKHQF